MTCSGSPRPLPDLMSAKPAFALVELAEWLEATVPSSAAVTITGVCTDSRAVEPGDLYLALPGAHAHGLDFEAQASARGAVAAVSDRAGAILPTVVVHDPRRCAGPVSARIHSSPSWAIDVYGVTGTNGKTSTTYLLDAALTAAGEKVGTLTGISISGPGGVFAATRTTPEAALLHKALARFRDEGATAGIRDEVAAGAVAAQSAVVVVEPDRRRAFDIAVANAQPGDVIVVAGRGCDPEQVFGDTVLPFDDREELLAALQSCSTGVMPS